MKHKTPKISSIEKALDILMAFTHHNHERGTAELSQKLGFPPATVNRILQILSQKGLLQQNERTRKFSLGSATFQLGKTIFQSLSGNLLNMAMPHLVDLCEKVGETVVLEVLSGKYSVVTYIAQSRHALSIGPRIGDRVPVHAAAGAKAMLAFFQQEEIAGFLDTKMRSFTPKTITDLGTLRRELEKARKEGVAFCQEEMALGVNAIGAPIFDHENKPVAAVVIAGLASRVKCDVGSPMITPLKKTASDISAQFFHQASMDIQG
ncbi:MAG: IclR family transcriptional regulator [Pseudomonadota bacterium]